MAWKKAMSIDGVCIRKYIIYRDAGVAFNRLGKLVLSFEVCRAYVERRAYRSPTNIANLAWPGSARLGSARKASARVITIPSSFITFATSLATTRGD